MSRVAVRILHAERDGAGPLERSLLDARLRLADRHRAGFAAAGADDVRVLSARADDTPFGVRLRALAGESGGGLVVLGSGALPLATLRDRRAFVGAARGPVRRALANNRYSADAIAIAAADRLPEIPNLPADNPLPRWLEEVAGWEVADLRHRWRLGVDLDSPLDVLLADPRGTAHAPEEAVVRRRLGAIRAVAHDRRAELLVSGRTSAATLAWLERAIPARVRALVEERGLRARSRTAMGGGDEPATERPPRSVLGSLLDSDGPGALGRRLAELADAAVVDTRVLLAHRLGPDEAAWPPAEDRFASDLLLPGRIGDRWLRALTESALAAPIPVVLGGHTLVGPALRLALR